MRVLILVLFSLISIGQCKAEARSYAEASAAYSLLNGDLFHGGGWDFSLTKNLMLDRRKPWLGIQADFSGHYQSKSPILRNEHSFLFGPQFEHTFDKFTVTAHTLAGFSHTSGVVAPRNSFAACLGAGVDWHLNDLVYIRFPQVDYEPLRLNGTYQHNARFSMGITFHATGYYDRAPRVIPPESRAPGRVVLGQDERNLNQPVRRTVNLQSQLSCYD